MVLGRPPGLRQSDHARRSSTSPRTSSACSTSTEILAGGRAPAGLQAPAGLSAGGAVAQAAATASRRRRRPVARAGSRSPGGEGLVLVARPLRSGRPGPEASAARRGPGPGEPHRRAPGLADVPPRAGRPARRAARLLRHPATPWPGARP
ncbi:MAG: hypothetical protein MZW92_62230 [Comamonadaceae bacterium]|nr:hypothetical protein [Comamonadaceae bacterium]